MGLCVSTGVSAAGDVGGHENRGPGAPAAGLLAEAMAEAAKLNLIVASNRTGFSK